MSEKDLAYGIVPNNVRASKDFREQFDPEQAYEAIPEEYDLAILGVPEEHEFIERLAMMYEGSEFQGTIHTKPGYIDQIKEDERLNFDPRQIQEINYEDEPSRRADLEALNQQLDSGQNVMLMTWSYNVPRTNFEANDILDQEGAADAYAANFEEFDEMNVGKEDFNFSEWLKGAAYTLGDTIPQTEAVTANIADKFPQTTSFEGESFNYSLTEHKDPHYITVGVPWSDQKKEIDKRHSMETFKNNLVPGWQEAKDLLKKPGRQLTDEFNF
jgi:hypothetical protein